MNGIWYFLELQRQSANRASASRYKDFAPTELLIFPNRLTTPEMAIVPPTSASQVGHSPNQTQAMPSVTPGTR